MKNRDQEKVPAQKNFQKAKQKVFYLLKIRFHSEKEIRVKLSQKKFPPDIIDQTIDYFKKINLIDDRQFAQKWIAARLAKPFGFQRIKFELKTKGVAPEVLNEAIENASGQYTEMETVMTLTQRQVIKYKNMDPQKRKQRLYGYLARRGFNAETVLKALNRL